MDLRRRRLESGLTQAELAARAGVSRQLVAAVEAGRHTPAVDAAMRLARALGTTVEELFSAGAGGIVPALSATLDEGSGFRLGRVGDQLVAAELPDNGVAGASWATPDGVVVEGRPQPFARATAGGLVVAGCDPALGIAEAMLAGLGDRSLLAISAPTGSALDALVAGRLHAAMVHGVADELPSPPLPVVRWHFARWRVGLAISRRLRLNTLDAVLARGINVVQRDPAAASQVAFERACRVLGARPAPPVGSRAAGHLDGARIASIRDVAAVTTESAARAFGLQFVPFEEHAVEVWVDERWLGLPGVGALGELLASSAFTQRVASFGGYDLTACGQRT
jgi:transcriptional regulator with XRE-family HTH domain